MLATRDCRGSGSTRRALFYSSESFRRFRSSIHLSATIMAVDAEYPAEASEIKVKKSKKSKSKDRDAKEEKSEVPVESTSLGGLYVTVLTFCFG